MANLKNIDSNKVFKYIQTQVAPNKINNTKIDDINKYDKRPMVWNFIKLPTKVNTNKIPTGILLLILAATIAKANIE